MPLTLTFIISFFIALFAAWKQAKTRLYHERVVFDSVILAFVGMVVGARLLYIAFHFSDFGWNILRFIVFGLYPGFSAGGALLGIAVVFWVLSDKKTLVPFPEVSDVITRALYIGIPVFLLGTLASHGEQGVELAQPVTLPFLSIVLTSHPIMLYKLVVYVSAGLFFALYRTKFKFAAGIESVFFWIIIVLSSFFIDFFKRFDVYYWKFGVDQWTYGVLLLILVIILLFQIKNKAIYLKK